MNRENRFNTEKQSVITPSVSSKLAALLAGFGALIWFLVRVIPKPSRASYPCQRAAFPVASAFVMWVAGSLSGIFALTRLRQMVHRYRFVAIGLATAAAVVFGVWISRPITSFGARTTLYNWTPADRNVPHGTARGINPGRVVWAHNPAATHWAGNWNTNSDQWFTDANTDQNAVGAMMSATLQKLTSTISDQDAWHAIFLHYNLRTRNLSRGPQPGETVAVKVNLNNSNAGNSNNRINASPQMVLALVRQLVNQAHVAPGDILVYDARRDIYPYMITRIWSEFPDVRFLQQDPPSADQPLNPKYGGHHGLEGANWVPAVTFSANNYNLATQVPQQVVSSTYLISMALLKGHSYPYGSGMEGGDEGQTAITMTGKNFFGSILGTSELHAAINTDQQGTANAYSPMVDLHASPNLGAKVILYLLDGLYCGRKHSSYPVHFPNPPFNNQAAPYQNPQWPASLLASLDPVALDSVGLDIYHSQSYNNDDPSLGNHSRILVRENADDYLYEMALADNPPSKTHYVQNGKTVASLGVLEHWDSDASRKYTRNKDRVNGKGIELQYLPLHLPPVATPVISVASGKVTIASRSGGARIYYTTDGSVPNDHSALYSGPFTPGNVTVNAVAMSDDLMDSAMASASVNGGGSHRGIFRSR